MLEWKWDGKALRRMKKVTQKIRLVSLCSALRDPYHQSGLKVSINSNCMCVCVWSFCVNECVHLNIHHHKMFHFQVQYRLEERLSQMFRIENAMNKIWCDQNQIIHGKIWVNLDKTTHSRPHFKIRLKKFMFLLTECITTAVTSHWAINWMQYTNPITQIQGRKKCGR